jgi:methylenetetrahydrofolate reductase (NADPH)
MRTIDLFKKKKVLSLEIFPPNSAGNIDKIYDVITDLEVLEPDFISVTYGAGGSENSKSTLEIASTVKNRYQIESIAHLPCANLSKSDVLYILEQMKQLNIENILALRGDLKPDSKSAKDFQHASDLISFIKDNEDFNIIGACYPQGHPESVNIIEDIQNLKKKVDAGTNQLISQLFFENSSFYTFIERTQIVGIDVPIQAGIMPVINKKQINHIVSLCGVSIPDKLRKLIEKYEHNPVAMRDAGIAYAIDQIVDLITQGVDGIHLYTMNNIYIAQRICEAIASLIIV